MDFDEFARFTARHFQPLSVEEECDLIVALISGGGSSGEAGAPVRPRSKHSLTFGRFSA